jgi:hypothetical protein
MSRALYHLSYGTAEENLTLRPRPRLQLALLLPVLGDGDALPFIHTVRNEACHGRPGWSQMVAEVGFEPTTFGL